MTLVALSLSVLPLCAPSLGNMRAPRGNKRDKWELVTGPDIGAVDRDAPDLVHPQGVTDLLPSSDRKATTAGVPAASEAGARKMEPDGGPARAGGDADVSTAGRHGRRGEKAGEAGKTAKPIHDKFT